MKRFIKCIVVTIFVIVGIWGLIKVNNFDISQKHRQQEAFGLAMDFVVTLQQMPKEKLMQMVKDTRETPLRIQNNFFAVVSTYPVVVSDFEQRRNTDEIVVTMYGSFEDARQGHREITVYGDPAKYSN